MQSSRRGTSRGFSLLSVSDQVFYAEKHISCVKCVMLPGIPVNSLGDFRASFVILASTHISLGVGVG